MSDRQALSLALAKARQQLQKAQAHVAALEEQLGQDQSSTLARKTASHQKQHIASIEEMQCFLQSTLDAFPANTAVLDPDGTIININASWKNFAQANGALSAAHYLGVNYLQVCDAAVGTDAEEAAKAAEGIRAVIAGRQDTFYIEYPCHSPAEERWFGLRVTPFEGPTPRHVVVAHLNIIERKRAEAALQASYRTLEQRVMQRTSELQSAKERVEAILNNSSDSILLIETDLSIQQMNASFNQFFRCEPDAYLGKSLVSLIDAEDADTVTQLIALVIAEQQGKRVEIRAKRSDGTAFDAELSVGVIKGDGLVCTIRDISERKAQERYLRYQASVQENLNEAVITSDLEFRIQSWNRAAERMYGWRAEEVLGQTVETALQTQFASEEERHRLRQLLISQGNWQGEAIQRRQDGSELYVLGSITLLKDEKGIPFGIVSIIHDITERKAYEGQLRYHASLQANVSDAVIVTDPAFRIQSWNRAAERIYGWRAEEVIGKATAQILQTQFLSTDGYDRSRAQLHSQGWWQGEVIQRHKDGTHRHILGSITLIKDERGIPATVVAINHDISERKQAEEALQKSAAEIQDLYNNAPCGYHSLDQNGVFVQINDTELRWLGYTREEVINKLKMSDILTPEGLLVFQKSFPLFKAQGWINELQFDIIRRDGSLMHILLNGTAVYDENGQYIKSRSILFDITELRQAQQALVASEARYRLLAENVTDVITKVNPIGIRTFVTPSCYALAGYTPEELIGKHVFEIVHPADWHESQSIMQQALKRAKPSFLLTHRIRHKAGHYIWVEVTTSIVHDPATDQQVEMIGVIRDISERKRAEAALTAHLEEERVFQRYLKGLHEITIELTQIDELGTFYRRVVELGRARLGFERLALFLYEEQEDTAVGTYGTDIYGNLTDERQVRFIPAPTGIMWRAFDRTEPFHVDENIPLYNDMEIVGFGWNAAAVLWDGDRRLGWLVADNLLYQKPLSKPLLDTLGLYALTVGALLAHIQAQLALRESEERFRQMAENIDQVIFIRSGDDRTMLYINPRYETLWGKSCASLYEDPSSFADPIHPDDRNYLAQQFTAKRYLEEGYTDFEYRIIPPDQRTHWVRVRTFPIKQEDGTILRRVGIIEDITERKQIAAELERQRAFLRNVIDVSPNLIFVKDYDSRFVLVNPIVAKMYNTTVTAMIGKSDADFNFSQQEITRFLEADRRVISTGEPLFIEEPITNTSGETHWLHTTKVPIISADGKSNYVLGVATDITERIRTEAALKESEEKYRWLVETMRGGLVIYDMDDKINYVNDRFCELLGYTREELLGTPFDVYVDATHETTREVLSERTQRLENTSYEIVVSHKAGKLVYLLVSGSPLFDKNGEYNGSFAVVTDITAQKQAEETLRQALAKEKELSELKSRFVSMASHEFRTPLATILALTETLSAYRHKLSDAQIEQRFGKIKIQIDHLKDIMEDVLLLAQMQARRVVFNPTLVNMDDLCRSVLAEFQGHVDSKHQLDYTCGEGVHAVKLDPKLMRQILSNLLSNAIKYSPTGKSIEVSLTAMDETLILQVRDEGIGIPEADLKHLFEPFHRAANVGAIPGTGLGLVITKESVELHGGEITVESQLERGTTFTIHIPLFPKAEIEEHEMLGDES